MNNLNYFTTNSAVPSWVPAYGVGLALIIIWSLIWKGLALWHSARRGSFYWFIALTIINTVGILEIIYLFGFAKLKFNELFSKKS